MKSSSDSSPKSCFAAILRRLLCNGSLPTHPSDQCIELAADQQQHAKSFDETAAVKQDDAGAGETTPGVVARLMGLNSLPAAAPKKTLSCYLRSRSVSSIDFLSHDFYVKKEAEAGQHRRVRTCISSREFPFLLQDDIKFRAVFPLVEDVSESAEHHQENQRIIVMKVQKRVCRSGENGEIISVEKKSVAAKKVEMEEGKRSVGAINSVRQKKDFQVKTRKNVKELRTQAAMSNPDESNSKDTRSVSRNILKKKKKRKQDNANKIHPESTQKGIPPDLVWNESKKSQMEMAICQSRHTRRKNGEKRPNGMEGAEGRKVKEEASFCHKGMLTEMGKTREEKRDGIWWDWKFSKSEEFEETSVQLGQHILELLLKQMIDELVHLSPTAYSCRLQLL